MTLDQRRPDKVLYILVAMRSQNKLLTEEADRIECRVNGARRAVQVIDSNS